MTVKALCLIEAKFAANSDTAEYTVPNLTRTIIDKFTVVNTDVVDQTLTIHLVPNGGSADDSCVVVKNRNIPTGTTVEISDVKNHVLNSGDGLIVSASVASLLSIRASGREVT